MNRRRFVICALAAGAAALGASCAYYGPGYGPGYGPPPHAPAHGYRHKYGPDVVLVYDAGLGVYVVSDRPRHYFHDGRFLRFHGGLWQFGDGPNGPWRKFTKKRLPPGLRKKH